MIRPETVLPRLAEWQLPGVGRHTLAIHDQSAGWTVAVTADRRDQLGCLCWEITLRADARPALSGSALEAWARRAALGVKAFMEPLEVIEVDPTRNEALLRSKVPSASGDSVLYYELRLQGTFGASVRRFRGSHRAGHPREQVTFALTHEALARLAADLTSE
jgi:hypothetical protein